MSQTPYFSIRSMTFLLSLLVLFIGWGIMVASYIHGKDPGQFTIFSSFRVGRIQMIFLLIQGLVVFIYDAFVYLPDCVAVFSHACSGKMIIIWATIVSLVLVGAFGFFLKYMEGQLNKPYKRSSERYRG